MNALIIHENGFDFRQAPDKRPGNGEVKIKLKTAGLNHRDLFLMKTTKPETMNLLSVQTARES